MAKHPSNERRFVSRRALLGIIVALTTCKANDTTTGAEDAGPEAHASPVVAAWLTTGDRRNLMAPQPPISFVPDATSPQVPLTVDVDETQRFQTIDGFGAALTDSSAWLIWNRMSPDQRDVLMRNLFDSNVGAGFSLIRHVAGASDFALSNYTYDDVPVGETDPELKQFSIDHDRAYIIPVMKDALARNPALLYLSTPWTAPAWMKTSQSLIGGSLDPQFYGPAADYLERYVHAFEAEGLRFFAISLQNEPLITPTGYPGMMMTSDAQADLIVNYIGPLFARAGVTTKLLIFDHDWARSDFPIAELKVPGVTDYAAGTAFHCYAGDVSAQSVVHDAFPTKDIWETECSGVVGSPFDADLRWNVSNLLVRSMRDWSRSMLLWNLALDETSGPKNGGCQNCRGVVTIHQDTGDVEYNVEYYALWHGARAAVPGAARIASNTFDGSIEDVAFANPDGTKGLVVLNNGSESTFKVRWNGMSFTYDLPAGAVVTFRWPS